MSRSAAAPLVLVVPLGVRSAPWACRSLRARGLRVVGADPGTAWKARTKDCPELLPVPDAATDPDGFAAAVDRICRALVVSVVLPLDDASVLALAGRTPGRAVVVGPTAEQAAALMDKAALPEAAAAAGLVTPAGTRVGPDGPDGPWPPLPSIVKRRVPGSPVAAGAHVPLTAFAATAEERDAAVEELCAASGAALVQEHVAGRQWRLHAVRTATELRSVAVRTLERYPPETGPSSLSATETPPAGLVEACARLLDAAGYEGPAELEVLEWDGDFFLHDANLRLSASVGCAVAAGLDVPALAVEAALGRPLPPLVPLRAATYASLEGEGARLAAALRHAPGSAPAWRIAASLAAAALLPGRLLDPLEPRRVVATLLAARDRARTRRDAQAPAYWDGVLERLVESPADSVWRRHCDRLNAELVDGWLDGETPRRILKTDLFEEAVGDGIAPLLARRGSRVTGIDVAATAVRAAAERHPEVETLAADVRSLPFPDGAFDAIVSTSTLDHFAALGDVELALEELHRVLAPGGALLLTLDNGANPVIALRGALPHGLLRRLGVVPYRAGATCGPRRLEELVRSAGFAVEEVRAVMHVPRIAGVAAARHVEPRQAGRFLRLLARFERLERLPTRWLSGYYIAVRAQRP